jgi:hypothetical protein
LATQTGDATGSRYRDRGLYITGETTGATASGTNVGIADGSADSEPGDMVARDIVAGCIVERDQLVRNAVRTSIELISKALDNNAQPKCLKAFISTGSTSEY